MPLKAGVARIDITPPVGCELCGYGVYLERRSTGVLDPLYGRALVLESDGARAAVVSCDLIGLTNETVAETRRLIEAQTGIPGPNTLLGCSHTHAGPVTIPLRGWGEPEPAYTQRIPGLLADAVTAAARDVHPARVGFASGEIAGLAINRVEGDQGPVDTGLSVMRAEASDGAPLATVYSVSAHGVTHFPTNTLISADWIGVASGVIEAKAGGEALFLQGSCGDLNPALVHTGQYVEAGTLAGESVAQLVAGVEWSVSDEMRSATQRVALPLQVTPAEALERTADEMRAKLAALPPGPESLPERAMARFELDWAMEALGMHLHGLREDVPAEFQALRIGDGLFLSHGGELFAEYGLELRRRFAPRPTFVVGYANGFIGYVPDPEDFERGGYAALMVPKICNNFPFTTDVGTRLVEALDRLGREVTP
jgi:Neutral/alkaline non-lysosomal ceramidase, N-terminal